jgi:membrane protease YdiL (CAAX protease family)
VLVVMVLGALAHVAAWRLVASERIGVWVAMSTALGSAGIAAFLVRRPSLSAEVSLQSAALLGLAAGVALFVATRLFVRAVLAWGAFQRDAVEIYGKGRDLPLLVTLVLAVGVATIGEELLWRGLVQGRLTASIGRLGGALVAWLGYVAVNIASGNLAIVLGAAVGGAVWAGLAVWTRGVLAGLVCHGIWTSLMLAFPVVRPAMGSR